MTITEMTEVMLAYKQGKKIEVRMKNTTENWRETKEPFWNWGSNDYRIAGEPKYRPYKDTEEMIVDYCHRFDVIKTKFGEPLIWVMDKKSLNKYFVTFFGGSFIALAENDLGLNELFENFTYLDDSPIGIKE